jgi:hypothetical protein
LLLARHIWAWGYEHFGHVLEESYASECPLHTQNMHNHRPKCGLGITHKCLGKYESTKWKKKCALGVTEQWVTERVIFDHCCSVYASFVFQG